MSGLQLTPKEYLTAIIMSNDLFIIVEGSDDQDFFTLIYNHLQNIYINNSPEKINFLKKVRIETTQQIKGSIGNRQKVETICLGRNI